MKLGKHPPTPVPEARAVATSAEGSRPSEGELEREFDRPEMGNKELRDTCFRPFGFLWN